MLMATESMYLVWKILQELLKQHMGTDAESYVNQMMTIIYDVCGEMDDIYDEV